MDVQFLAWLDVLIDVCHPEANGLTALGTGRLVVRVLGIVGIIPHDPLAVTPPLPRGWTRTRRCYELRSGER